MKTTTLDIEHLEKSAVAQTDNSATVAERRQPRGTQIRIAAYYKPTKEEIEYTCTIKDHSDCVRQVLNARTVILPYLTLFRHTCPCLWTKEISSILDRFESRKPMKPVIPAGANWTRSHTDALCYYQLLGAAFWKPPVNKECVKLDDPRWLVLYTGTILGKSREDILAGIKSVTLATGEAA